MDTIVQKFRDLLAESVELLNAADLISHNLTLDIQPHIGGDFDVKDGWETAVMVVKNQHGVNSEIRMGFEIVHGEKIRISPLLSAWHQETPEGEFPIHTFSARDMTEPLYHDQLDENTTLSTLINELLDTAVLIEPSHLISESWKSVNVTCDDDREGTDRRPRG